MADPANKPSAATGAAKIAAAFLSPVPGLVGYMEQNDKDVQDFGKATLWGLNKTASKAFGFNPAASAMSRVNMVGAAVDALGGDGAGMELGRMARDELQHQERDNSLVVAGAEGAGNLGLAMIPGAGAATGAEGISAALARRGFGKVVQGTASGAVTGAPLGLYDSAMESAHQQMLEDGKIDDGKVAAAAIHGGVASFLLGGALGGGGAAVAEGVSKYGGKIAQKLRGAGANQFMRESGMMPSEIEAANKDHGRALVDSIDNALGEASSKDGIHQAIIDRAEQAGARKASAVERVRSRMQDLASFEKEAAEGAAAVAERNAYAKGSALQDELAAEMGAKKSALYDQLATSEAKVAAATERRNAAQSLFEQHRDGVIVAKQAELAKLQALDPAQELRAEMRSLYNSERQRLAAEIEAKASQRGAFRNQSSIDALREKQSSLLDDIESKFEGRIASAEKSHQRLLERVQAEIDAPERFIDKAVRRELRSAEKGLSSAFDSHAAGAERLSKLSSDLEDRAASKLQTAMQKAGAEAERDANSFRALADKRAQSLLDDIKMLDGQGKDLASGIAAFEKKHGKSESLAEALLADKERAMFERLANARRAESVPIADLGILDKIVSLKRRLIGGGAFSAAGGLLAGPKGALAGGAVDFALKRAVPNYGSRMMYGAGGLAEAAGATMQADTAARSAVQALFSYRLPSVAAGASPGFISQRRDANDVTNAHVQQIGNVSASPAILAERVQASVASLPVTAQAPAATKIATVVANIQRRAPQPAVMPSPFGGKAQFSLTAIHDYEDYAEAAASPASAIKAMRSHSLTPAMADAIRENWPELLDTMREEFVNVAASGREPDTQAIRQFEILTGESYLPEDRPDNVKLFQNFYDQSRRTNQAGSQGGGSAPAGKSTAAKASTTPVESMSVAR